MELHEAGFSDASFFCASYKVVQINPGNQRVLEHYADRTGQFHSTHMDACQPVSYETWLAHPCTTKKRRIAMLSMILAAAMISSAAATPAAATPAAAPSVSALQQAVGIMHAGLHIPVQIDQSIKSKTAHVGDTVSGETVSPIMNQNNYIVVPVGTPVEMRVSKVVNEKGQPSDLELQITYLEIKGFQPTRILANNVNKMGEVKPANQTAALEASEASSAGYMVSPMLGMFGGIASQFAAIRGSHPKDPPVDFKTGDMVTFTLSYDAAIVR